MDDTVFYIAVLVLVVLFWGEPDLHDKLMSSDGTELVCPEPKVIHKEKDSYWG